MTIMLKRSAIGIFLSGAVLALCGLFAGTALAGVAATKHNLSTSHAATGQTVYSSDNTEICVFCHTPHDAIKNNAITLWNHTLSTVTNYGVYTSPTFDAGGVGGTIADLGIGTNLANATASNLCLSCHDGTVAINSFNNASNINLTTTMVGTKADGSLLAPVAGGPSTNLGNDLTNDHPVNFTYDAALVAKDATLITPGDATGNGLANGLKLFGQKVQCASCHDPHTSAQPVFLRASMAGSTLCLSCHNK
jgi:predicted CXXCH cytochrome family protein